MKGILTLCVVLIWAMSGVAKDLKTVVFTTTPEMHCESCENKIKKNLRFERGVKNIATDVEKQRVTIEYDADKTNPDRLAEGFRKIGYEVAVVEEAEETES